MFTFQELKSQFSAFQEEYKYAEGYKNLYDPMYYILSLGGKQIRPLLTLAGYNLYHEKVDEAFEAALCTEVFHNFSLVHDDIMDDADIRRGKPSVHIAYDTNAAILTGDVMLIHSYKLLEKYESIPLFRLFSQTAQEVCEGQRLDMDFETRNDVNITEYLTMISLKTSVLIAAALKMGALIAGAEKEDQDHLYEFGKNMGIAFQIQDDLLDTFGDQALVGKKIGGDIIQKKKTYLYLKSLELLSKEESEKLKSLYAHDSNKDSDSLVDEVKSLFKIAHVDVHAQELKLVYQQLAMSHLNVVQVSDDQKAILRAFAVDLLDREL